jgi:hypothetical protein
VVADDEDRPARGSCWAAWAILGLVALFGTLGARGQVPMRVIAVIWLVLAVGYLASAAALTRRRRSRSAGRTPGEDRADP